MELYAKGAIQIQKPIEEVFEGIVNPEHMTKYFISESTGRIEDGIELKWKFPEFPDAYPVFGGEIINPIQVSFSWDEGSKVKISLESLEDNSTLVKVKEGPRNNNEENVKWVIQNTEGWANFLACLKAYLEYGISLRKGAFEFMRPNS